MRRRACYLALGVTLDGYRDVFAMWFQESEGGRFWLQVLNELKQRGVQDVLIACVDGLKGFPEAIEAVFPATWVQTVITQRRAVWERVINSGAAQLTPGSRTPFDGTSKLGGSEAATLSAPLSRRSVGRRRA